jgi:hypothetical protein
VISACFQKWNCIYEGIIFRKSWNSGTLTDYSTHISKKLFPPVLPLVVQMLHRLHKVRRGQQWPVRKVRICFVLSPRAVGYAFMQ